MILHRFLRRGAHAGPALLAAMASALAATPAQADVMEIGDDGAQWVAGGGTAPVQGITAAAPIEMAELSADYSVPVRAVVDSAINARGIPAQYAATVDMLAERYELSPALIEAVVWQESRWRADAVSHAGARGLAQLMPGTAREMGVNPDDPYANLEGGARYLRIQLDRFDGDLELALAAYNAGPNRVARAGGIPRIRETQTYVAAIIGRLSDHSQERPPQ